MSREFYNDQQLAQLARDFQTVKRRADNLMLAYTYHSFADRKAREYASQGFSRRVGTIRRCIVNLFDIISPSAAELPSRDALYDAQINIQAFVANVYGCADNLAWIWIYEKGLGEKIDRRRVGLRKHNTEVRESLSVELRTYVEGLDTWIEYLIDFRDALAHRIPLYIPPGGVPTSLLGQYKDLQNKMDAATRRRGFSEYDELFEAQMRLLIFRPMMTHSLEEAVGLVPFHVQMLSDFATIEELGNRMLSDLAGGPVRPVLPV